MVEGARLESVYTGNCIKGSNPFLSAIEKVPQDLSKQSLRFLFCYDKSTPEQRFYLPLGCFY